MPDPHNLRPDPRVAQLEQEIAALRAQLHGEDPAAIQTAHRKRLHEYNEVKDTAQALIGKYAVLVHTTVRAVHEELGLPTEEE